MQWKATILFLVTAILVQSVAADNSKTLQQIKNQIQNLKTVLTQDQNQQTHAQQQLQQTETRIGSLAVQLHKTQQNLSQQQTLLRNLQQQQVQYEDQLQLQQAALAQQLRMAYILQNQQYLKILLNQQDPNQLSRIFTYYHYINQQRLEVIHQYRQTLQALQENKLQIQKQTHQLLSLQNQQQKGRTELEKNETSRKVLLSTLRTDIQTRQQQLNVLTANKQALERVVHRFELSSFLNNTFVFKHHGRFPWPTKGKISQHFGTQIEQSQLKWNGILIQAPEGQNVYAISPGRVVFANWMAGYGLLLIIDHGNGYMTIYGRSNSLYKKVGDSVKTGDLIATVGNTGGYNLPALYFAIRQNGKPIDPERWCG